MSDPLFDVNNLLSKVESTLQDAFAAADADANGQIDEYEKSSKAAGDYFKLDKSLSDLEGSLKEMGPLPRSPQSPSAAPASIPGSSVGDASAALDDLAGFSNLLSGQFADIMNAWADATKANPFATEVDFGASYRSLQGTVNSKINLEGTLHTQKQDLAMVQGLSRRLSDARARGDTAAVSQLTVQIMGLHDAKFPPQAPQVNPFTGMPEYAQQTPQMSPEQAVGELIAKAQSDVGTTKGQLDAAVAQLPADWRNLSNTEISKKIDEAMSQNPAAYFSNTWKDLEMNGDPNKMTLQELGAIKEFVQKMKERLTAVMAAMARIVGMVGDTLLGVARLQQ